VHNYQCEEIQREADFLGDSLDLARKAAEVSEKVIVFCGVTFMAETAKILSPQKTVLLPRLEAGCPMADMVDVEALNRMKLKHPKAAVVTYVNSSAAVKAESDVCCTSANAVRVVQNIEADEILFVPDKNLAHYVQRFTQKRIIPWDGHCYVHNRFTAHEVQNARSAYPQALLMVHPECPPEVVDMADEVLSTNGMVKVARESDRKEFIVGTEEGLILRLRRENPDKTFHSAGKAQLCRGMKATRLHDLLEAMRRMQHKIFVPESTVPNARRALERMLNYA